MSIHLCPDCIGSNTMGRDCETCKGSRYVHRNSWGRITHPASPEEYLKQETARDSSYRTTYGRRLPTKFPRWR